MSSRNLSQAEIDALLPGQSGQTGGDGVVPYDFGRPDRVGKEEMRAMQLLHERFAVNVSTSLSAYLRTVTEVTIVSTGQLIYSEFLMSLPDSTAFYALELDPLRHHAAMEISPSVAFTVVDRMLGGKGSSAPPARPLTEIELNVVDAVVKVLVDGLTDIWKSVANVQFRVRGRETRPQMLQVTDHNEVMVLLAFDMRLGDSHGPLHLCLPAAGVETVVEALSPGQRAARSATQVEERWLLANLARAPMTVTTELEMLLPARDLMMLKPDDVLALPQSAAAPVDVRVGGMRRFTGRLAASAGDSAAVVIDGLLDANEIVEAA